MDGAELQSRHDTVDFLAGHRKTKGTMEFIQGLKARPEQVPEFQTWLANALTDHKTSYTMSGAAPWALLRAADQVSADMLLNDNVLDIFSAKHARRPVTVSTIDKLYPKLMFQGSWQGSSIPGDS